MNEVIAFFFLETPRISKLDCWSSIRTNCVELQLRNMFEEVLRM